VPTPELASPGEVVVWCQECRSHEIGKPRRSLFPRLAGPTAIGRAQPLGPF
jgi:hypothetical protein